MRVVIEETGAMGTGSVGGDPTMDGPSFPPAKKKGVVGEDAPVNNVGGGAIKGTGGLGGEPGVHPKDQPGGRGSRTPPTSAILGYFRRKAPNPIAESRRGENFAGAPVFEVSSALFYELKMAKRKGKHWRTYLNEDDCYQEIREYAMKNKKGPIAVRNEASGEMMYVRY